MSMRNLIPAMALVGAVAAAGAAMAQAEDGPTIFAQTCAACHQPKGQGLPGFFPALAGNAFVQSDPKNPAYVLLHGRGGMPNLSEDLSDDQIAAVLTYVRSSWGNHAPAIDAKTVAAVRGAPAVTADASVLPFH